MEEILGREYSGLDEPAVWLVGGGEFLEVVPDDLRVSDRVQAVLVHPRIQTERHKYIQKLAPKIVLPANVKVVQSLPFFGLVVEVNGARPTTKEGVAGVEGLGDVALLCIDFDPFRIQKFYCTIQRNI